MKIKHKNIGLLGLTAVLLLSVVFLYMLFSNQDMVPFSLTVSIDERTETIDLWESEDGAYYAFLPAHVELNQVSVHLLTSNEVRINGIELAEGTNCEVFQLEIPYQVKYKAWNRDTQKTLTFMQSANVAAMYIDTQSGNMDYIHEKKGNKEAGKMRLYTADGTLNADEELTSIYGRGNQTWTDPEKKPYGFALAKEADLLEMGSAQKWVLFANAFDASHMRNKIAYTFADQVGMAYSPDSEWVDLYLNGEYVGLYLLCERNEIHPERINLTDTDSYLVSMQIESRLINQNYPYIRTEAAQALRVHNPQNPTAEHLEKITEIFQQVENALIAEDGVDPVSGKSWDELIDMDSWAKMFLIDELFGNVDACYSSLYFYVDVSDSACKVYAGPVWDYDHSMGNTRAWHIANPQTIYANRLYARSDGKTPWFHYLYQKESFFERMAELYETEFMSKLEAILNSMDDYAGKIEDSAYMDSIRWSAEEGMDLYEETAYVQDFVAAHASFLSDYWLRQTEYKKVTIAYGYWDFYGYFYVKTGECITGVPELSDTNLSSFLGWYRMDTDEIGRAHV